MPLRIQLKRTKGWRMPEGAIKVDRSTRFGNTFKVGSPIYRNKGMGKIKTVAEAVEAFRMRHAQYIVSRYLSDLRGKDLACWCKLCPAHQDGKPFGEYCEDCAPCHADSLGDLANRPLRSVK